MAGHNAVMGDCEARDRSNAVADEWSIGHHEYTILVRTWQDGGLFVDLFITVHHGDWLVAQLDCAHSEIHTHFYGFRPSGSHPAREIERKVHTELPRDSKTAAYAINSQVESCYNTMVGVAEGRRP